ncbi:MAG: flagellar basal body P-ring protein FlgI [Thermotogae bacterium]|nr:flagellar basal body P-ring protein FlgI [Thermotogota bacterium]
MKKCFFIFTLLIFISSIMLAAPLVRIKDIATFRGARDNQLFGIGIVVGLKGTGDSGTLSSTMLKNMLEHFGSNITASQLKSKNTAVVSVTADIPAFYKEGMRLDITVSSIGDAKSLRGGVLLQTPLYGADNKVYAVAQGAVSLGGEKTKATINKQDRYPLVGNIPRGAIVEREIPTQIVDANTVTITLNSPDFTTAARVMEGINERFSSDLAKARDAASVVVKIPQVFSDDLVSFLSILEEVEVSPDMTAKVIVNERTGTVVLGGNVKISDVVVSYGNFNVSITTNPTEESTENTVNLSNNATVGKLIRALSALGATPQDMIAILEAIKEAGALHARLIVM